MPSAPHTLLPPAVVKGFELTQVYMRIFLLRLRQYIAEDIYFVFHTLVIFCWVADESITPPCSDDDFGAVFGFKECAGDGFESGG